MAWFWFSVLLLMSPAVDGLCDGGEGSDCSTVKPPCKEDALLNTLTIGRVTGTNATVFWNNYWWDCVATEQELRLGEIYTQNAKKPIITMLVNELPHNLKQSTMAIAVVTDLQPCTRYTLPAEILLEGEKEPYIIHYLNFYTPTESSEEITGTDWESFAKLCVTGNQKSSPIFISNPTTTMTLITTTISTNMTRTMTPLTTTTKAAVTSSNTASTDTEHTTESVGVPRSSTGESETSTTSSTTTSVLGIPTTKPIATTYTSKLIILITLFLILAVTVGGFVLRYRGLSIHGLRWIFSPEEAPPASPDQQYHMGPLNVTSSTTAYFEGHPYEDCRKTKETSFENANDDLTTQKHAGDNVYDNLITQDRSLDNVYVNVTSQERSVDNVYDDITTQERYVNNVYVSVTSQERSLDNAYVCMTSQKRSLDNEYVSMTSQERSLDNAYVCMTSQKRSLDNAYVCMTSQKRSLDSEYVSMTSQELSGGNEYVNISSQERFGGNVYDYPTTQGRSGVNEYDNPTTLGHSAYNEYDYPTTQERYGTM